MSATATTTSPGPTDRRRGWMWVIAIIGLVWAVAAGGAVWTVATRSAPQDTSSSPTGIARSDFLDSTGVRVIRVVVTGGGGLVDLRYQVIDPDKALVVHDAPPTLIDEDTGRVVDTLFMGHSHGGEPKAGYTYPLLFVNEQGLIEPGGTVTVVIGIWRLEHVPVL